MAGKGGVRGGDPEFYERYQVARTVVSPATQPATAQPTVLPVKQPQSIAA